MHHAPAALVHIRTQHALHRSPRPGAGAVKHRSSSFDNCTLKLTPADGADIGIFGEQYPTAGISGCGTTFAGYQCEHCAFLVSRTLKCGIDPVGGAWQCCNHQAGDAARFRSSTIACRSASGVAGVSNAGTKR